MCVAFWTFDDPDYALILCSNRDEFLNRPTINARFHSFCNYQPSTAGHEADLNCSSAGKEDSLNNILSGIDKVGGGTWLGMTRSGKVALLTNITEPPSVFASSRGSLVSSFLLSEKEIQNPLSNTSDPLADLESLANDLYPRDAKFAGFNLLLLAPTISPSRNAGTNPLAGDDVGIHLSFERREKIDEQIQCQGRQIISGDLTSPVNAYQGLHTPGLSEPRSQSRSLRYVSVLVTNSGAGGPITVGPLSARGLCCGGISNGVEGHGGNEWPKVKHGVEEMERVISELRQSRATLSAEQPVVAATTNGPSEERNLEGHYQDRSLADSLFDILTWQSPEPVTERYHLRRTIHVAPIPIDLKPRTEADATAGTGNEIDTKVPVAHDEAIAVDLHTKVPVAVAKTIALPPPPSASLTPRADPLSTTTTASACSSPAAPVSVPTSSVDSPFLSMSTSGSNHQHHGTSDTEKAMLFMGITTDADTDTDTDTNISATYKNNTHAHIETTHTHTHILSNPDVLPDPQSSSNPGSNANTNTKATTPSPSPNSSSGGSKYYGTRLSTVLLIRRNGEVMFVERDIWKRVDDKVVRMGKDSERVFRFKLNGY